MVHHAFEAFRERHPDFAGVCHYDFFDSAPELVEASACHTWLTSLDALRGTGQVADATIESLKRMYARDKNNGSLRKYWDNQKLQKEAEQAMAATTVQTLITVNRTTARVMQSAEKSASSQLEKLDRSVAPATSACVNKRKRSTTAIDTSTRIESSEAHLSSRKEVYTLFCIRYEYFFGSW